MAPRISQRQDQQCRSAIQTSQLINRLQANALGDLEPELSAGRIKSIETLLKKTIPDLQAITISGDEDNPLRVEHIERIIVDPANTDSKDICPVT